MLKIQINCYCSKQLWVCFCSEEGGECVIENAETKAEPIEKDGEIEWFFKCPNCGKIINASRMLEVKMKYAESLAEVERKYIGHENKEIGEREISNSKYKKKHEGYDL